LSAIQSVTDRLLAAETAVVAEVVGVRLPLGRRPGAGPGVPRLGEWDEVVDVEPGWVGNLLGDRDDLFRRSPWAAAVFGRAKARAV